MPSVIPPVPVAATTRTTSASISLIKVASWDGKSQNITQALIAAFEADDYLDCVKNLQAQNIEPLSYINSLDKVDSCSILHTQFIIIWRQIIDSLPSDSELRKRCIRALKAACGLYGILPTSYVVTSTLTKPGTRAFTSGGFADVWRVIDENDHNRVFAVKSFRVYEHDPIERINKVQNLSIRNFFRG